MKATNGDIGKVYKVRLLTYKSIRHYGGRDITTYSHIINSTLVGIQEGGQPYIVTLNQDLIGYNGKVSYRMGHKIAIRENDFDLP